jgi:hypothetical protein
MKNVLGIFVVCGYGCGIALGLGLFRWLFNVGMISYRAKVELINHKNPSKLHFSLAKGFVQGDSARRNPLLLPVRHSREGSETAQKHLADRVNERVARLKVSIKCQQRANEPEKHQQSIARRRL